jgi:hypothetical protein
MLGVFRPFAGRLRDPLSAALANEVRHLEIVIARVAQALYLGGVALAVGIGFATSSTIGLVFGLVCVGYLAWYTALAEVYERVGSGVSLRVAAMLVDSTVPWVFATALLFSQGAEYALSSWVPPFAFCALIAGAVVRLRPEYSLFFGVTGAVVFLIFYFALVRGRLHGDAAAGELYGAPLQLMRAALLVLAGVLAALATRGLRQVVGRAEGVVRAQDLFGKYRLIRRIASGGMGEVFEAIYSPEGGFERRVAIKRIHAHLAGQPAFVDAFRSEAELSAHLVHTNLVQVMDFGRIGETCFRAMEYVDGVTLSAFFERAVASKQAITPDVVGYLGVQMLAGLAHAHEKARGVDGNPLRVIHRDLCPANVLVSRAGEVKIADFGVARALRDATSANTRNVVGHIGYLAPEQVSGIAIDPRSDLFAAATILWELLARRHLFLLDTDAATLLSLMNAEVAPISSIRSDVDSSWDSFFARALASDPSRRFQSASEMAGALTILPGAIGDRGGERLAALVESFRAAAAPDIQEAPTVAQPLR